MARLETPSEHSHAAWNITLGDRDSRKIGHNTYVERRGDDIAVKYHATDVVTYHPAGTVTLNTGGWRTSTTKARLNQLTPRGIGIYSTGGVWRVLFTGEFVSEFYDGLTITDTGALVGDVLEGSGAALARVKRAIGGYVRLYDDDALRGMLERAAETGTAGDCLYCQLGVVDGHLELHVEEGYAMVTTAYNAVKRAGYRDPAVILNHAPDLVRRAIRRMMVETLTDSHGSRPARDGMAEHWA